MKRQDQKRFVARAITQAEFRQLQSNQENDGGLLSSVVVFVLVTMLVGLLGAAAVHTRKELQALQSTPALCE